jgi:DegV family protein with EDD domain
MTKIAILTDSTAYLENDYVENNPVKVIPLSVHFQGMVQKEGPPGTYDLFFKMLSEVKDFPTTSQPSAGEFLEAYKEYLDKEYEIIVITISSGISGTWQSANTALEMTDTSDRISIIDSQSTAGNLKAFVQQAVKLASEGKTRQEIVAEIEAQKEKSGVRLTVDTLEYLKKGGRLSNAGAMIGNLLNIRPVLGLINGTVQPVFKARGKKKALQKMLDDIPESTYLIHAAHVVSPAKAQLLKNQLVQKFPNAEVVVSELGPVIGSHLGPGALGVLYLYK